MKHKTLKLDKIRIDGDTQPRAGISTSLVADYAEAMEAGNADFPPAVVFFDGADYWLADGFHRWHAANKNDLDGIYCEIHNGTVDDARWYSYSANQTHGQRRSNADKEKAVKAALLHPKGAGMSDTSIAEHVGVDVKTVGKYRSELVSTMEIPESTSRQGRDGRTINTTNIGKGRDGPAASAKQADKPDIAIDGESKPEKAEPGQDEEDYRAKWLREAATELHSSASDPMAMADFLGCIVTLVRSKEPAVVAAILENIVNGL